MIQVFFDLIENEKKAKQEIEKLQKNMEIQLSYFGSRQDAWVLNANHARTIGL